EGGTEELAKAVEVAPPAETEPQPYDEFDIAVIRATQGDMPIVPEPYAPAAENLSISQAKLLIHLQQMQERKLLRRVAAILFHRRPRPLQGRVRRDPRFDRRADRDQRALHALLLDRVQEDPAALFHRRVPRLGARTRRRVSRVESSSTLLDSSRSAELYAKARR